MKILTRIIVFISLVAILSLTVYGFTNIEFEILSSPSGDDKTFNFEFKINVFDEHINNVIIVVLDAGLETEIGFKTELNRGKQSYILQYINPNGDIPSTVSLVIGDSYYLNKVAFETVYSGVITANEMQKSPYDDSLESVVVGNRLLENSSVKTSVPTTAPASTKQLSDDSPQSENTSTSTSNLNSERLDAAGDYSWVSTILKPLVISIILIAASILLRKRCK